MNMVKAWLLLLCALLMPALAAATSSAMPAKDAALQTRAEQLVASVSHGQQHVLRLFPGPDGLLGAVIENQSKLRNIAWLSPSAEVVLDGSLLNSKGEDLYRDAKIQQGLILSPGDVLGQTLQYLADRQQRSFDVGTAGPHITVLFDPNCAYCRILYRQLTPLVTAGDVRVRYVLVGVVKDDSAQRAASILAVKDRANALADNEGHFDTAAEEGGFPIAAKVDPKFTHAVMANNLMFASAGMTGTPSILYCDKAGKGQLESGVPKDIKALVTSVGACR